MQGVTSLYRFLILFFQKISMQITCKSVFSVPVSVTLPPKSSGEAGKLSRAAIQGGTSGLGNCCRATASQPQHDVTENVWDDETAEFTHRPSQGMVGVLSSIEVLQTVVCYSLTFHFHRRYLSTAAWISTKLCRIFSTWATSSTKFVFFKVVLFTKK